MARKKASPVTKATPNCWEFWQCGRHPGDQKISGLGVCPAATAVEFNKINGGKNGGRFCWFVAGTLCGRGEVEGTFAWKLGDCLECDFYRSVERQEGANFLSEPAAKKKPRTRRVGRRKTA
jgi:hypothetical protein